MLQEILESFLWAQFVHDTITGGRGFKKKTRFSEITPAPGLRIYPLSRNSRFADSHCSNTWHSRADFCHPPIFFFGAVGGKKTTDAGYRSIYTQVQTRSISHSKAHSQIQKTVHPQVRKPAPRPFQVPKKKTISRPEGGLFPD